MSIEMEKKPVPERFQHLLSLVSSERFLTKQGLGNEVPFFICPYRPEEAVEMGKMQKQLQNRLEQSGVRVDSLKAKVTEQLQQEKAKAEESVNSLKERVTNMEEFGALTSEQQQQLIQPFDQFIQELERQTLIAVIRDTLRRFEDGEYPRLLAQMGEWAQPKTPDETYKPPTPGGGIKLIERKVEYVTSRSIRVPFDKAWLEDESDVDRYLAALKEAMMKEISDGKRVQI